MGAFLAMLLVEAARMQELGAGGGIGWRWVKSVAGNDRRRHVCPAVDASRRSPPLKECL
jgi:hypothetical protein